MGTLRHIDNTFEMEIPELGVKAIITEEDAKRASEPGGVAEIQVKTTPGSHDTGTEEQTQEEAPGGQEQTPGAGSPEGGSTTERGYRSILGLRFRS